MARLTGGDMGDWKEELASLAERMRNATATPTMGATMTTPETKTNRPYSSENVRLTITLAMKIAIHRDMEAALERVEGTEKWRYKDATSDESLANKHGVGEAAVRMLRLELFGHLQRSDAGVPKPTMVSLEAGQRRIGEQLAEFARRLEALEKSATKPVEPDPKSPPVYYMGNNGVTKQLV